MGQGDPGGQHQTGGMKSRPKIGKTFHIVRSAKSVHRPKAGTQEREGVRCPPALARRSRNSPRHSFAPNSASRLSRPKVANAASISLVSALIDSSRRTVLTTGAAAAATAAAPQVLAQAPQTSALQGAPAGAKTGYYEKGNVRIRYTEIGTGFPLLATPGGGLNSRIAVWANAVINIPEEFKNDF